MFERGKKKGGVGEGRRTPGRNKTVFTRHRTRGAEREGSQALSSRLGKRKKRGGKGLRPRLRNPGGAVQGEGKFLPALLGRNRGGKEKGRDGGKKTEVGSGYEQPQGKGGGRGGLRSDHTPVPLKTTLGKGRKGKEKKKAGWSSVPSPDQIRKGRENKESAFLQRQGGPEGEKRMRR